ncbi:MAG: DUF5678 domain-containing protein, partial [Blastocatellia bacterium]
LPHGRATDTSHASENRCTLSEDIGFASKGSFHMPSTNVVKVVEQIAALSAVEQRELWSLVFQAQSSNGAAGRSAADGIVVETASNYDHAPRLKWMEEHEAEFAGQYIALDGDRLIAHGVDPKEVFAALRAAHPPVPYFGYIPSADAPPTLGANLTL